ncbi:MAG: hypothetical protein LBQ84_06205 [Flavobacteriaceae bacterium]|nr:hypothetical protein [Flavobacteriaceae bacterium]
MEHIPKLSIACLLLIGSCNIDVADKTKTTQISETIEKSKANGVFLAEYKTNWNLIQESWVEEPWLYDTHGNIKKKEGNVLYIVAKDKIGLSRTLDRCINGGTSNGNRGHKKKDYITMRLSEEELAKDSLIYYVYSEKEQKCLGELTLIKKK